MRKTVAFARDMTAHNSYLARAFLCQRRRFRRPEGSILNYEVVGKVILTKLETAFKLRTFIQTAVTRRVSTQDVPSAFRRTHQDSAEWP